MANDRENLREDQRRPDEIKSRSIEETESSSYYDFSGKERHEIDSRSRAENKDRSRNRRRYSRTALEWEDSKSDGRDYERTPEYRRNETEWRYDESTGRRYEPLESGGYAVHPGKDDCFSYFQTGKCRKGRSICKYNHPTSLPQELPEKTVSAPVCKYFLCGHCKKGSDCGFPHTMMDMDGAEPMPQELPEKTNERVCKNFLEGRCKKGSRCKVSHTMDIGSEPMHLSGTIPDSRPHDPRGTFENIRQRHPEIERECEQERRVEIPANPFMAAQRARERREAQDNMKEQRSGGRFINLSHLINPIANEILRERKRNREIEWLSREESPIRSSKQFNSIN